MAKRKKPNPPESNGDHRQGDPDVTWVTITVPLANAKPDRRMHMTHVDFRVDGELADTLAEFIAGCYDTACRLKYGRAGREYDVPRPVANSNQVMRFLLQELLLAKREATQNKKEPTKPSLETSSKT